MQKNGTYPAERTMARGWVRWTGFLFCLWASAFAVLHFHASVGITLSSSHSTPRPESLLAWLLCGGMLSVISIVTGMALIQYRRHNIPPTLMQLAVYSGGAVLAIYLVYCYIVNGLSWMLAAGILCTVSAVVGLALTQPWGKNISRPLLLIWAWLGGVILILHALYGLVVDGLVALGILTWEQVFQWLGAPAPPTTAEAVRQQNLQSLLIWNPWFLVGGLLLLAIAWHASDRKADRG